MHSPTPGGSPSGAGASGDGEERLRPHPVSLKGAERWLQVPRLALVCLPGTPLPPPEQVPERQFPGSSGAVQGSGFGEQLLLLFPHIMPGAPEGGARSAGFRSPGRARQLEMGPSPVRSRCSGPMPLSQKRTRSRPSVHLWGVLAASRPLLAPPPSRRPRRVQGASAAPGCQDMGDGRLGPRGRCQGEGRVFVCFLLSWKTEPSPGGVGCAHSPWRCRPRKRPSDRPCPGGGGGSSGGD